MDEKLVGYCEQAESVRGNCSQYPTNFPSISYHKKSQQLIIYSPVRGNCSGDKYQLSTINYCTAK